MFAFKDEENVWDFLGNTDLEDADPIVTCPLSGTSRFSIEYEKSFVICEGPLDFNGSLLEFPVIGAIRMESDLSRQTVEIATPRDLCEKRLGRQRSIDKYRAKRLTRRSVGRVQPKKYLIRSEHAAGRERDMNGRFAKKNYTVSCF